MNFVGPRLLCIAFLSLLLALPAFSGCAPKSRIPENVLDTPRHHASTGFKLIKKGYLYDADREFNLAVELDPHYSPAYLGLGLVYGIRRDFKKAFEAMGSAKDYAKDKEDKALACMGFMRLYSMQKANGWLKDAEGSFLEAIGYVKDLPEAYYYMGIAYEDANRINESRKAFEKVLEINKRLVPEAHEALGRMKK
ncbi:MAG: tetratricopeptide repeat protein [Pseudomonadota bacterium]